MRAFFYHVMLKKKALENVVAIEDGGFNDVTQCKAIKLCIFSPPVKAVGYHDQS